MKLGVGSFAAFAAFATIVGVCACTNPAEDCSLVGVYAVRATITDSITAAPLAHRASLIIRDGAYVDSVPWSGTPTDSAQLDFLIAGPDREGTYDVTVRREGWRVWTRADVRAPREKGCNVKQAQLTVRLQRTE
jgi:hypothetical protein